ncbi:MAG: SRPBCC domain-containing protein [Ktedonobacteraceae bacterium]
MRNPTPSAMIERCTIAAEPGRVWAALTDNGEITRWWSNEAHFTPVVGTLAEFRFRPPAGTIQFEVAEVDQGRYMHWTSRQGPPHWAGTSVTWQLEPVQSGTNVVFTHDGFTQVDEAYERTQRNWRYFLDSLKSYLEAGKGTPGTPPNIK